MSSIRPDVTDYEIRAIKELRKRGLRVTMPRVQVIRALATSSRALSPYQLHSAIHEAGGRIDVVSVYRILATLVDIGLAHHIGIVDGYLACHLEGGHGLQSEHLVCRSCGEVTEAAVPEEALGAATRQIAGMGFRIEELKIEVLGLCAPCAVRLADG
jgi:Fe2+ or Zn2+ uptake regulation protein